MATKSFSPQLAESHSESKHQESGIRTSHDSNSCAKNLLELPPEILTRILSYLPFKTISELRRVSRHFNDVCATILNNAFNKLVKKADEVHFSMRLKRSRQRSSKSEHPLDKHISGINWFIPDLRGPLFYKRPYLRRGNICFFPGEVLDLGYRRLREFRNAISSPQIQMSHTLEKEWQHLLNMANDHFELYLEPMIPKECSAPISSQSPEDSSSAKGKGIKRKRYANTKKLDEEIAECRRKIQKLEKAVSKLQKIGSTNQATQSVKWHASCVVL